jgi:hypothetical protein
MTHLRARVDTPQRKHQKELPLPKEVDPKPVKASYQNGVLAILFKKKSKGEKIRIQQLNRARKMRVLSLFDLMISLSMIAHEHLRNPKKDKFLIQLK